MDPQKDCLVYLRAEESRILKDVFKGLRDILDEVSLNFCPDGFSILQMDQWKTTLINLYVDGHRMDEYVYTSTDDEYPVGISLSELHSALYAISVTKPVEIYVLKSEPFELNIRSDNKKFVLDIKDVDGEDLEFPTDDYELDLPITHLKFKDICNTIKASGADKVSVTYEKGDYIFKGCGGKKMKSGEMTVPSEEGDQKQPFSFKMTFDLQRLTAVMDCMIVEKGELVHLRFGEDLPLVAEGQLACGQMGILLGMMDEID